MLYTGIDLGTTNSAICTYDGNSLNVLKSEKQEDVTPSALFYPRRGGLMVGRDAYVASFMTPDRGATLFKRFMGTATPVELPEADKTLTPVECSAEVLRTLYQKVPESARDDSNSGTVITVPAAFNVAQKDATKEAAALAGIGKVCLIQEPVAAMMAATRIKALDGTTVIFDLGGGTLDVSLWTMAQGKANNVRNDGIANCGGRDWDRSIVNEIVEPWLRQSFTLPDDARKSSRYKTLFSIVHWSAERAKIALAALESGESKVVVDEHELRWTDDEGTEGYVDVGLDRAALNLLIEDQVAESVETVRKTLAAEGLSPGDVDQIVFVGGPTMYGPLRDRLISELGIAAVEGINPMTAVAEGAALHAESVDWSAERAVPKPRRGTVDAGSVSIRYQARTEADEAMILVLTTGDGHRGGSVQVDNLDDGWTSGRMELGEKTESNVPLPKVGVNSFRIRVFDGEGRGVKDEAISISRTVASVESVRAAHSIGLEVLGQVGGRTELDVLVNKNDPLPKTGAGRVKAVEKLRAGADQALRFNLWEGEIEAPVHDNHHVGTLEVSGTDLQDGTIPAGGTLEYEFDAGADGCIALQVKVAAVQFVTKATFFSREEGERDFRQEAPRVNEEGERLLERIERIEAKGISHEELSKAKKDVAHACELDPGEADPEAVLRADEKLRAARGRLDAAKKDFGPEVAEIDLEEALEFFDAHVRETVGRADEMAVDNAVKSARRTLERSGSMAQFERLLETIQRTNFQFLWRQDGFVASMYQRMAQQAYKYPDQRLFRQLVAEGEACLKSDDIEALRRIVGRLHEAQPDASRTSLVDEANILRA